MPATSECAVVQDAGPRRLKIELLFLPPYSPNLNLIERLWKFVKKECLSCRYHEDFTRFKAAIVDCLEGVEGKHKGVNPVADHTQISDLRQSSDSGRVKYNHPGATSHPSEAFSRAAQPKLRTSVQKIMLRMESCHFRILDTIEVVITSEP